MDNNTYLKDGRSSENKKDCSVIALAYAFDLPYVEAYNICKKHGRVHNTGFNLNSIFKLTSGKQKRSRVYKGRRIGYHSRRPGMSVGKFRENHPKGIYILRVGGHIFTMIDGVCLNQVNMNSKISYYFYVTKPKENDSTSGQQEVGNTEPICRIEKHQAEENIEARCGQMDQPGQTAIQIH